VIQFKELRHFFELFVAGIVIPSLTR